MDWIQAILADEATQNVIIGAIGLILTWIINRVAAAFTLSTGLQVEKQHRDALHSAIISGVESALERGPGAGVDTIKRLAVAHAHKSVPDAIRKLVPGDGVLDTIAERYARSALQKLNVAQ